MVHPHFRRAAAVLALSSILALIPLGSAHAAVRPYGERHSAPSWLRVLVVHLLEKVGVQIDPNGLAGSTDTFGPH